MQWRVKKEAYHWTLKAKLLITLALVLCSYSIIIGAYSFLSPHKPIEAKIMVVEAWLNDYALQECLDLFSEDNYDYMIVAGGPLNGGYILMDYRSTAEIAKATLLKLGADSNKLIAVNRKLVWRNRTYQTAVELKKYLKTEFPEISSFNLVSLGAHSRRSWLLFERAMPEYEIGIITIGERLYDKKKWWHTSKGFRTVFTESIGYIYIKLFFFPNS